MATRTGVPTMLKLSKELVRLITKFLPVIQKEYPGNDELVTALKDCSACALSLIEALAAVREYGD